MQSALAIDLAAGIPARRPWWPGGAVFAADFLNARYMRGGLACSGGEAFLVQRSSPRLAQDQAGHWHPFAPDVPALTDTGLWVDEARGNGVRNGMMAGAVAGSPGSLPDHWQFEPYAGIDSCEVVATGTVNGLPFVDLRLSGTTTQASGVALRYDTGGVFAAGEGADVTFSCYVGLAGGSVAGTDVIRHRLIEEGADASPVHIHYLPDLRPVLETDFIRVAETRSVAGPATATLRPDLELTFGAGQTLDLTLRLAAPQIELGTAASAPILSAGSLGTRAADVLTLRLPEGSFELTLSFADAGPQTFAGVGGEVTLTRGELAGGRLLSSVAMAG